jgi:serine/threonine protein kinase
MSPELLDPDRFGPGNGRPTKNSDCYALGMVILEVLSGEPPFPNYNGLVVMRKLIEGELPERPQGAEGVWFTDDLWEMLQHCWSPLPEWRPTIDVVLECLKQGSTSWQPLPPDLDDYVQSDSDDQSHLSPSHDRSMFLHLVSDLTNRFTR